MEESTEGLADGEGAGYPLMSANMSIWTKVAERCDLSPGQGTAFQIEGVPIAVFDLAGKFYGINDSCPHMGASLASGRLNGCIVTCAAHGMKVNVIPQHGDGIALNVRTYPVDLRPDGLYIDIE